MSDALDGCRLMLTQNLFLEGFVFFGKENVVLQQLEEVGRMAKAFDLIPIRKSNRRLDELGERGRGKGERKAQQLFALEPPMLGSFGNYLTPFGKWYYSVRETARFGDGKEHLRNLQSLKSI
ncbi:MAG: hypothetical protein ACFB4I_07370 [Cyanophyceae cyanobacterium]